MDKCNKYEALFTFATQEELEEHIKTCPECKKQHEEMEKISSLVKEAKPLLKKKVIIADFKFQVAALFLLAFIAFFALNNFDNSKKYDYSTMSELSIAAEMGLPTDEYGLLLIE